MKLYEIILQPLSGLGTPLKGDTIFGHFCWQVAHDSSLLNGGLERWVARYSEQPFAVFSSAWPKLYHEKEWLYALKRPDLPPEHLFPGVGENKKQKMESRKKNASRKWFLVPESLDLSLDGGRYVTDGELADILLQDVPGEPGRYRQGKGTLTKDFAQPHNSINRMTMTTGEGMFAPYTQSATFYPPGVKLALFVLIDEEATDIERVSTGLERIGQFGFGKDASTGWGRLGLGEVEEKPLPNPERANACYTLAPAIPEQGTCKTCYYAPFTRYGRHGDVMATSANPFKNPVIMADEGAVIVPASAEIFKRPYLGRAAQSLSKALPETVVQGYTPYLPFQWETMP